MRDPDHNAAGQEQEQARQRVERFVQRFQPAYRQLVYYAALPLILTPELLNYLRNQFLRRQRVPWVAEVDLLLSDLCRPIGYEQYVMETAVRAVLLDAMVLQIGKAQMEQVARLLIAYVRQVSNANPYWGQAQRWAAMLYLEEQQDVAVQQMALAYRAAVSSGSSGLGVGSTLVDRGELARLSQVTQALAPSLQRYDVLLDYAGMMSRALQDPALVTPEMASRPYDVLGVELPVPQELIPTAFRGGIKLGGAMEAIAGLPPLMVFEFEVATIAIVAETELHLSSRVEPFEFEAATIAIRTKHPAIELVVPLSVFQAVDEAVFYQTGERLSDLQRMIFIYSWEGITYKTMGIELGQSPSYLSKNATALWKHLSAVLDRQVSKSTLQDSVSEWAAVGTPEVVVSHQQLESQQLVEALGHGIDLEMVVIPEGSFVMGSPEEELERSNDEDPHPVTLQSFCMGKYPVTQAQWQVVAALPQLNLELNPDPSHFKGADRPVENVSWLDAVEFCDRLSRATGRTYRLPTEAEWEYACRAGTTTPFHFGETLTTDLANYRGTDWEYEGKTYPGFYGAGPRGLYRGETTSVGSFKLANAFGLYDMHGDVWEWCADHWHGNYDGAPTDGSAWLSDDQEVNRLLRGGSWGNGPASCRSASRVNLRPGDRGSAFGFRVVCSFARTAQ